MKTYYLVYYINDMKNIIEEKWYYEDLLIKHLHVNRKDRMYKYIIIEHRNVIDDSLIEIRQFKGVK